MLSTFTVTLSKREQLVHDVYHFEFSTNGFHFEFKAGQYVILHIPQPDGKTARRLYSMASSADIHERFELIVEIIPDGVASKHLMEMQIGDTLTVQGPAGMFFPQENEKHVVFLATGTGIAPMRSIIDHLIKTAPDRELYLFWGFKNMQDTYLFEEFKQLNASYPNFKFMNCLSREENLECVTSPDDRQFYGLGHVNDGLEATVAGDLTSYQYYLCGGPKVIESLREYLANKGVPKENVHFEKFTI